MRSGWTTFGAIWLVIFLLASPWSAVAQGTGPTAPENVIQSIEVEGNLRVEDETIESYLAVSPGDPFSPDLLDRSLKNLFATGLFDDVTLSRRGDVLVVAVVENPIINRIAFEGNNRLEDETLETEIQLRPRVVYTRSRVQNAVSRILELYRRNGRFAATVEPKVIELQENRVDLVFEINEGPLTGVEGIIFIGNEAFSDGTLRGVIETQESAWYRFFTSADTYDPDRLAFDQELLRRFYLARGYADFNVKSAIAELTQDGQAFFITFTVEEGQLFEFGEIEIESRLRDLEPEELRDLVETETGDTYDADEIETTIQAMISRIGELGYAFVQIDPVLTKNREMSTVDVNFVINEGPRVYVERIEINGNVRTLDEVIRREFRLAEGDPFNAALIRRSRQRLRNLGFFEKVDIETQEGSAPDKVVIVANVTERSTGELSFGAGFSTADGLLGDVRLSERNLLGRGQELSAQVTASFRRLDMEISFTEPYFLDRELAAGFDIFRREADFKSESSFKEQNTGFTLRAGYPLREHLRHSVRYTLSFDKIKDVSDGASRFIKSDRGDDTVSSVGHTLTFDRRDSRFLPSEGYLLRGDQDFAGVGGDRAWVRHEARGSYYYSIVPNVVLELSASGGNIFGLGDDTKITERFFLGGTNLRGFQFAGVGPRDDDGDDALGGNTYGVGTVEMRFPLGLPEELGIFGRAFVEGGTLTGLDFNSNSIDDSGSLRSAGGVGLSWVSPVGPLAIDFALPITKEDEDKTEFFRVSFGTRF